jgi:hypothetical protein
MWWSRLERLEIARHRAGLAACRRNLYIIMILDIYTGIP